MKSEAWWMDAETDPTHVAAADWLLRLQDPRLSLEDTLAWQDWMNASPRHAEAFHRLERVSDAASQLRGCHEPRTHSLARGNYDGSMPLSRWHRGKRLWPRVAIAASILLPVSLLLAILLSSGWGDFWNPHVKVLTTEIGENRTVPLEDGSQIMLGGNSRAEVALSKRLRTVNLQRGEAFFVVAGDPVRPFKVRAGDATVTALGTEFNVRRESDRVVVAVTDGRVLVEPASPIVPLALLREFKPKLRSVHVAAGEGTFAGAAGIEDASKLEDLSATTAWQTGRLAFRLQPLKYVLEDVNRYAAKPIVVEDQSIGALIITGTVARDDIPHWIDSLEHAFGLRAVEEPERILLRRGQ